MESNRSEETDEMLSSQNFMDSYDQWDIGFGESWDQIISCLSPNGVGNDLLIEFHITRVMMWKQFEL
jgi:hypothetical protein